MTSASTVTAVAPGRVNLIGEHTDYNGGLCLPFAIPLATTASITRRDDRRLVLRSDRAEAWSGTLQEVTDRRVTGWAAYVAGVVWALLEAGWEVPGLDVDLTSTLPLGGGLSSSAALECSVALGLAGLLGHDLGREGRARLAELCRRAETEYVGAPTGGMDQLASLLCTPGRGILIDFAGSPPATTEVPLHAGAAGLTFLVTDTGVRHELADGDGGYAQRRAECEVLAADPTTTDPVLAARGRHVWTENDRVRASVDALQAGAWGEVGLLMTASHHSLRDDFQVSCAELDAAVDAALTCGALGARMTGGGFGGCSIALVPAEHVGAVEDAIDRVHAERGWTAPVHHRVEPSTGARVVHDRRRAPQ